MIAKVLKFGGSSFLDLDDYGNIASYLAGRLAADVGKLVVVVSAMSGTTGKLQQALAEINRPLPERVLDATLATGEMLSACFLEAALGRRGVKASSLFGYSLGVRTDSNFTRASIVEVDKRPLISALEHSDVVVVAGGQAIDGHGCLTMLGRNSSDFSAVVLAATLGLPDCEIYSDVSGVYAADPYIVPGARLIPEIPHRVIGQMSRRGAKVLHYRAVEHAERFGVIITCKSLASKETIGTRVGPGASPHAVVVDRAATLLHFSNPPERDRAADLLKALDLIGLAEDDAGSPCICLSHDADFAAGQLQAAGYSLRPRTLKALVTEFTPAGQQSILLPNLDEATQLARQLHGQHYPESESDGQVIVSPKRRSAYSALLTAASE